MKVLIVDDEPWARFEMERLLTPYSWLTIIGQAASASEAIDYLEREDLDAIFSTYKCKMAMGSPFCRVCQLRRQRLFLLLLIATLPSGRSR